MSWAQHLIKPFLCKLSKLFNRYINQLCNRSPTHPSASIYFKKLKCLSVYWSTSESTSASTIYINYSSITYSSDVQEQKKLKVPLQNKKARYSHIKVNTPSYRNIHQAIWNILTRIKKSKKILGTRS